MHPHTEALIGLGLMALWILAFGFLAGIAYQKRQPHKLDITFRHDQGRGIEGDEWKNQ